MMTLDQVLQRLRHKAAARREEIAGALAKGHCADYAAYKGIVGEYRGLSSVDELIKDVLKEMNQEEDE